MDGDFPEDNSSSAGASPLSKIIGFVAFIGGYWMFNTIAISYILSKVVAFVYLGLQLITLTLQTFSVRL